MLHALADMNLGPISYGSLFSQGAKFVVDLFTRILYCAPHEWAKNFYLSADVEMATIMASVGLPHSQSLIVKYGIPLRH